MNFARQEVFIILATIVRKYDLYTGQPGPTLELYDTTRERDIDVVRDMIIPFAAKGSHEHITNVAILTKHSSFQTPLSVFPVAVHLISHQATDTARGHNQIVTDLQQLGQLENLGHRANFSPSRIPIFDTTPHRVSIWDILPAKSSITWLPVRVRAARKAHHTFEMQILPQGGYHPLIRMNPSTRGPRRCASLVLVPRPDCNDRAASVGGLAFTSAALLVQKPSARSSRTGLHCSFRVKFSTFRAVVDRVHQRRCVGRAREWRLSHVRSRLQQSAPYARITTSPHPKPVRSGCICQKSIPRTTPVITEKLALLPPRWRHGLSVKHELRRALAGLLEWKVLIADE
nr:hypothetical protein CFP56_07541 [Quercus suber]